MSADVSRPLYFDSPRMLAAGCRDPIRPRLLVGCLAAAIACGGLMGHAEAHDLASHGHDHHGHDHPHSHGGSGAATTASADAPLDRRAWLLIGGYSLLIALASLAGGALPGWINLTHTRMQHMISFVGGLMLGIGVFHLFPHAVHHLPNVDQVALWMMGGMVCMFFLLRAFHFHQHDFPDVHEPAADDVVACSPHDHDHDHDHAHDHGHDHPPAACGHHHVHEMGWVGVFLGLGLHTLIDGLALGASIQAELLHASGFALCGLGTFAAIALHKPLDAVSISSLMIGGGWSRLPRITVNVLFALLCPLGTLLFVLGVRGLAGNQEFVIGAALAFSAGVFICIALSDLLPEMEFHSHHRKTLSLALAVGIVLAWAIRFLEPAHVHG